MQNLILVDVDGVLNPAISSGHEQYILEGYKVLLNPAHGRWLLELAERTDSELIWCTYWQELANEHISPIIGLPELPYITIDPPFSSRYIGSNKAIAAKKYAGNRKFVMLEDETDVQEHLRGSNGYQVYVSPDFGLQRSHIEQAENYLSRTVSLTCVICNRQDGFHEDYCFPITAGRAVGNM